MKKRDLNKIKKNLPPEWKSELSIQSNLSSSMVEKVIYGLRKSALIVQLAIDMSSLSEEDKHILTNKLKTNQK